MSLLMCIALAVVLCLYALTIIFLARISQLVTRPCCPVCTSQDVYALAALEMKCCTCGTHYQVAPTWQRRIVVAMGYFITLGLGCVILVPLTSALWWLIRAVITT